jgi:uncharacterized membrane protein YozB (DUF420 family)
MSAVLSWTTRLFACLIVLLGVALSLNSLKYLNFDPTYGFLRLKQSAVATGWYLPAYYSHVVISAVILLIGFFQVSNIGRKWVRLHRFLGRAYVFGILLLAAPGGLVMSLFINRGPWVLTSFLLQVTLWFLFTSIALNRILQTDVTAHREWMWRSFALACAAITLRIYIYIFSFSTDLSQPGAYAMIAWASWVGNLVIVELMISYKRKTRFARL